MCKMNGNLNNQIDSKRNKSLPMLLSYRKQYWLNHCEYILENFLLSWANKISSYPLEKSAQIAVLIENRIDNQWLFTVLNTMLMCPQNTSLCLITDNNDTKDKAISLLSENQVNLNAFWLNTDSISPTSSLDNSPSFNQLMKTSVFWDSLPHKKLLIIQTDALLSEPLPQYFFGFDYLGAPFLPRVRSEYFETYSSINSAITDFYKIDTPFHCSPDKDVYPHLYGNGGLSIRNRNLMKQICDKYGSLSQPEEQEDVFFSRHFNEFSDFVPTNIAKAFSFETSYNKYSIGSHAAWKYLDTNDLADHLDKHLRKVWGIIN